MWWCGTVSIHSIKLSHSSKKLLPRNAHFSTTLDIQLPSSQSIPATGIVDFRDTDNYFAAESPIVNVNLSAPTVKVGTATDQTQQSTVTGGLNLLQLPSGIPITWHIMPGFRHTLIGVGPLCDADCTVTFTLEAVIVQDTRGRPLLTGWRGKSGPCLWRIALQPGEENLP